MITNDDVKLVFAYFLLHSGREYCVHEIAWRPTVRARFLRLAKQILGGDVPGKEIIVRLVALRKRCR